MNSGRRGDHSGHHRHGSAGSGHSLDADGGRRHRRSKSGIINERERLNSSGSQISQKSDFRSTQQLSNENGAAPPPPPPTRPTSLYPLKPYDHGDGVQPEKEALRFDVALVGAPPEVVQLVENIKQVAEQFLYHWKTFPIVLPSPVAQCESFPTSQISAEGTLGRSRTKYHLRDLFVAPSFDELDAVAVDGKGEPRRLTGKQLEYIREKGLHKDKYGKPKRLNQQQLDTIRQMGEFEVESLNFPGQQHRWRLSQLLQKGTGKTRNDLLNDLALSLRFLYVTARGRFLSNFFSVRKSFDALLDGLLRIIDILIGIPSLQTHNLDTKIREERTKYLVAELVCRPENEESLEHLCSYIRKQLRRATTEKFEVTKECSQPPVAVPYRFLTPSGTELDLRLWDRGLMKKLYHTLVTILEKETRGWFLHFRERLIAELRAEKMADENIEKEVNEAVMREYLQRVYNSILTHPDILGLGDGIAQLLVQQAQSIVMMHRAVENVQTNLCRMQCELKKRLELNHPILSRIGPWLRARLRTAELRFAMDNQWSAHEEALNLCTNRKLHQTIYFLHRDLAFMKEREPALLRELRKVKTPTRSFLWPTQIWMPTNWIVRRNFQGQSDVVPTVLSKQATSITTPRSDPSQPVFLVEKELVRTTTTRWPLWRLFNYFHRTWCWMWNAMFFFGIVLTWCSPVGLRALFSLEPFMPDLELSQINGTLFPRKSSLTPTLCSRLLSLWRHISKSRTHFETKPDTGFIGKGLTRHVNRIWNYVIKGWLGTTVLIVFFPTVCVLVVLISLFIALTCVVWMPLLTLTLQLTNAFIYDLDSPEPKRNRFFVIFEAFIWKMLLQGILQPVLAILIAFILCPTISLVICLIGMLRYWSRLLWDMMIFHWLIRKRGRVPAGDSLMVKRVAGPGLADDYYYRIGAEQALAAFEAKMELDELTAYQSVTESIIMQPQKDFGRFVEACFGCFSMQLAKNGPYKMLEKEGQDLLAVLHEKLEKRRRDLQTGLSVTVKSKIKMETTELKIAIQQGAQMLERFYPTKILAKLNCSEEEFWDERALNVGDWAGLAGHLYTELFSLDILTPLDHTDTSFRLDPHPQADLGRYNEMVHNAQLGNNGPDLLGNVYTPRGNIQVHAPYLDVSAFNPRAKQTMTCGKKLDKKSDSKTVLNSLRTTNLRVPWKKRHAHFTADKLVIPLPIPHPAHIACTIYNRDSDDPIPLESDICQCILRGIEESHQSTDSTNDLNSYEIKEELHAIDDNDGEMTTVATLTPPPPPPPPQAAPSMTTDDNVDAIYEWTLNDWLGKRQRTDSGSVRVDLASPEDVTLDSDSTRVVFSNYGTTV